MRKLEFDKNEYSLSIRMSSDGFSLYILDHTGTLLLSNYVIASLFQLSSEQIVNILEEKGGITLSEYNDVCIIIESDFYVFVPESVLKLQNVDDYFYFFHNQNNHDIVLFNRIDQWNTVNVFSIPAALNEAITRLFPDTAIIHHLTHFLSERISTEENSVNIWIRNSYLDVIVVKNGELSLINSFNYKTKEDFAYFVLSIIEQMKFNTEEIQIKLYQKDWNADFKDIICMYIKNCEIYLQQ